MGEGESESEKKSVEHWAEAKGMLPRILETPARLGGFAARGLRMNPKFHLFAQARAHNAWPLGAEVTEAEFDAAVEAANTLEIR